MMILKAILVAMSLCMDCLAVSICSSISVRSISRAEVIRIGLVFAFVQTGLMAVGWFFGDLLVGYVEKFAHWIGFLLLLYVGGSMVKESFSKTCEVRNLSGIRNVILGAIATSIDALAVGISLSMEGASSEGGVKYVIATSIALWVCTLLSVFIGMFAGHILGHKFGRWAELAGGIVLLAIGVSFLL
ncbi:MAG: manganese efflux pump [Bacteroidales bacterium]|nr:manganese efflux pump [Bacteroidales bacterium]